MAQTGMKLLVLLGIAFGVNSQIPKAQFSWKCVNNKCAKQINGVGGTNLGACKTICGEFGSLWPQPSGRVELGSSVIPFSLDNLKIQRLYGPTERVRSLLNAGVNVFKSYLPKMHPAHAALGDSPFKGNAGNAKVILDVAVVRGDSSLSLETDEGYVLSITSVPSQVNINIVANTYFGARHALETVSQLISFDNDNDHLQIINYAKVEDWPIYPHRGILVDTSRNFISLGIIKKTIDAMSYNKLNTFHWHITDTHSFPFYSRRLPQMTQWGAYSKWKIYTPDNITDVVEYGRVRGVKVLPEFDAPAHVGHGWQWAEASGKARQAVCVDKEPWQKYCVEPPCGQLNVVNEEMYDTLGKLYQDFIELFDSDIFHMGGDEVNINCWNTTTEIIDWMNVHYHGNRSEGAFIKLWDRFQTKAYEKLREANGGKDMPIVLWTSHLTEKGYVDKYLDKDRYIIQIWTTGTDDLIEELYNKKYRLIFSNYDAWYFDCGYGAWVGAGPNNWCSPYKGWQQVYDNSPAQIIGNFQSNRGKPYNRVRDPQILGGEAAMWTEQADDGAIEGKIWPRGAAMAERLWAEPLTDWSKAEFRMVHNTLRMLSRGINTDSLQPEWCHQNAGYCYL